ncbi:MAG: arsenate reductase (glutaredoxin) [Bacteroidota bacterium]|nr:arsenate reductase (glutaredoxin) [Bacteroidota bacterium]MDX5426586.1 arsenate reductase (glutaredoxin) [Bacteroidota bacterium]MDX5449091.1 arsenate reductase (glutaredoxin) [Bacteroidota bacterium]MDX5504595.1 arsenate reductase (glutaredoxin) [Bacteroidota bacterium]
MIRIYHNSRCGKSREGLKIVEESGKPFEVIEYMKEPITPSELEEVIDLLEIEPMDLVRTKEQVWKDQYADLDLDDEELIMVMIEEPRLMERPIVVNGEKAVVGRPPERIKEIL